MYNDADIYNYTEFMYNCIVDPYEGDTVNKRCQMDIYIYAFLGNKWARILVQVTIYRRLLIGRDGHLDQSEAYDIS